MIIEVFLHDSGIIGEYDFREMPSQGDELTLRRNGSDTKYKVLTASGVIHDNGEAVLGYIRVAELEG